MKKSALLITTLLSIASTITLTNNISIEPEWTELDYQAEQFGSSWVLIGNVTFKKQSTEVINMENLTLRWKGAPIQNLLGSLYRRTVEKKFLPIEDNLVCDGTWSNAKQQLSFRFDKQQNLGRTNIFCIVLDIPPDLANNIHDGYFEIQQEELPLAFRTASHRPLSLPVKHRSA